MQIKLQSDFRDFYDHWFCGSHQEPDAVLRRMSEGGMSRPDMFKVFEQHGLIPPKHGIVRELVPALQKEYGDPAGRLNNIMEVVVYLQPRAHRGEGKIKCSWQYALDFYPNKFAAKFIPATQAGVGMSLRYLRVGTRQFWLKYTSANDWRSNCGDVSVELLSRQTDLEEPPKLLPEHPLLAVDLLPIVRKVYAIDLNTAPGIKGTALEDQFSGKWIFEGIRSYYRLISQAEGMVGVALFNLFCP